MKLLYVGILLLLVPQVWANPTACVPSSFLSHACTLSNCGAFTLADANVSLESAIRSVQQRYPGKVLSARLDEGQGVYKIKIVAADGSVQKVWVDTRSGQIVGDGD